LAASVAVYQLDLTTNLTLDEILQGKAKLTRMNGEKASA
jgi:hypothetical protein